MIRALKSRNISTFEDISVHVHGDHHHQQLPHYEAGKVNQSCFNSQNPVTINHEKSSYSSTVSQYDCQPERKGVWEHVQKMWRSRLLDCECLHVDPAHRGELLWVYTLWPSPFAAPPPNPSCPILCALYSSPSSKTEVTWDAVSGVYIWTQPTCIP